MPQYFAEALVATEDHRFYTDPGVDPLALVRVTASWLTGHTDGGGSTLDQQLAKNLYTSGSSSFPQIVEQVVVAVKLDQAYSRAELLRLYAEIAYYGHGYYGLQAASCGYFGRPPDQLTVVQAAMLAGAVNAPTYDDPLTYPAQARARLVHVIDRMAAVGYLTKAQQDAALQAPLGLSAVRGCVPNVRSGTSGTLRGVAPRCRRAPRPRQRRQRQRVLACGAAITVCVGSETR